MKTTTAPSRARLTYTVFAKPRGTDHYERVAQASSERIAIQMSGLILADGGTDTAQVWVDWASQKKRRCVHCICISAQLNS